MINMNNLFYLIISINLLRGMCESEKVYNRYNSQLINSTITQHMKDNGICSIFVKPCTPHEGSRIDGTCNNFKHPLSGSAKSPYARLLSLELKNKTDEVGNMSSKQLPSARLVRTSLQSTGRVADDHMFTVAAYHYLEFAKFDVSALNGTLDHIKHDLRCCHSGIEPSHIRCAPITVPDDDPYLRVTGIRCLNYTKALTFQDFGCETGSKFQEQVNFQTPVLDLSTVYGADEPSSHSVRAAKDGLLKTELRHGRDMPLNLTAEQNVCFLNERNETACYLFGVPEIGNYNPRLTALTIFFVREHNRIAKALKEINPCWKEDRLFKVARRINIATFTNIYFYELLPLLLGYKNMVNYGLISDRMEFLSSYDEDAVPKVYAEYEIATRYFHTMIDGQVKMYDEKFHFKNVTSISDALFRTGFIEKYNFEEINRGTFYQRAAKIDNIQDPDIAEKLFSRSQKASDMIASDIQRGRELNIKGYNEYRHFCGMKQAKTFTDFLDVMDMEATDALKRLYSSPDDVDLLAGIMSERFIEDGYVGPTLFCIMVKQLGVWRYADRFWFERENPFHSFTIRQLHEIRRTTMARLACDNAEGIKFIQPRAFLNVGSRNELTSCEHIYGADLTKWRDSSCHKESERNLHHYFYQNNQNNQHNYKIELPHSFQFYNVPQP